MRLKSSLARFGAVTISCTSSRPLSKKRSSVVKPIATASIPTSTSRSPPMRATALCDIQRGLAAAPFVEQSRRHRHQAVTRVGIDRRPAGHEQHHRHDRHRSMTHRAQLEPVGERAADDARESERADPLRESASGCDRRHETCTSVAPGSARSRRPFGTTLSDTDGALMSHRDTAAAAPRLVTSK
jgi:hypothetical protein